MGLITRTWNLVMGIATGVVSFFERRNPEALLELEKENLRKQIGRFNEGLVSHAALSERLMRQVRNGETEEQELTHKVRALVEAEAREPAARYALQLKQVKSRLDEDRKQLEDAEQTYNNLVRTRDAAVAEARNNIEKVRRQIGDLKVKRAIADLTSMTEEMVGGIGSAGDSFDRLREMVEEEREIAGARARVAGSSIDTSEIALREAEQEALAGQALNEFLASDNDTDASLALPDLSRDGEVLPVARERVESNKK